MPPRRPPTRLVASLALAACLALPPAPSASALPLDLASSGFMGWFWSAFERAVSLFEKEGSSFDPDGRSTVLAEPGLEPQAGSGRSEG